MNPTDVSSLPLRDIHLPGPVGFWPPAVGWWILAGLVLVAAALYAWQYYRSRHRRVALMSLKRVHAALEQGAEPVTCLQDVSTVLRRFAMTTAAQRRAGAKPPFAGEPDVPGLTGTRWLAYLDSRWPREEFANGAGRALLVAPYARPNSIDRGAALALTALCVDWLAAQPVAGVRVKRAAGA